MKINWKVRFRHKGFLIALASLLGILVQQVASSFGYDLTIYNESVTAIFNTVLSILVLLGVVVDPTTQSVSDSVLALSYEKPKEDK